MCLKVTVVGSLFWSALASRGDPRTSYALPGSNVLQVDNHGDMVDVASQRSRDTNTSVIQSMSLSRGTHDNDRTGREIESLKIASLGQVLFETSARTSLPRNQIFLFFVPIISLFSICLVMTVVQYFTKVSQEEHPLQESEEGTDEEDDDIDSSNEAFPDADASLMENFAWTVEDKTTEFVNAGSKLDLDIVQPPWSTASVMKCLESNGIETNMWQSSAVESLTRELSKGLARLLYDKRLVRVVDIVLVVVEYIPEKVVAQEVCHLRHERQFQEMPERIPKARMQSKEGLADAVRRCLNDKLGLPGSLVQNVECLGMNETEESSQSLPSLTSIVRKFIAHVRLPTLEKKLTEDLGISSRRLSWGGAIYSWVPIDEVVSLRKYFKKDHKRLSLRGGAGLEGRMTRTVLGPEAHPIILWDTATILELLREHGIDNTQNAFGKSLEDILLMLKDGSCSFGTCRSTKRLFCVVDKVSLCVSANGFTLVESAPGDGDNSEVETSLPSVQKWANESAWSAAMRLSRSEFGTLASSLHMKECSYHEVITRCNASVLESGSESSACGFMSRTFLVRAGATMVPGFAGVKVQFDYAANDSELGAGSSSNEDLPG